MEQKNILLVDDEPANIQVLFAALQNLGKVQFATNGKKAIQLAEETPPDIIFLDYFMPDMNGLEVCKAIKANPTLENAQIIFVSGSSDTVEVELALDAGAFDFMTKPIIPKLVQRKVEIAIALQNQSEKSTSNSILNTGPQSILLVEDGAINRAIIAEILESKGHTVQMVETGTEAIAKAEENEFDCVLLDIHLPDMTGLKVIRHLRALPNGKANMRIVAVTGDVTTESLADYEEAGFDGVSPKPVNPEILLALVAGEDVAIKNDLMSAPDLGGPDLLIAQDRINVLKETYTETRLQGLFALFEKEVRAYLTALNVAVKAADSDAIIRTSHRLKSALGHFACIRMQKVANVLNKERDLPLQEKERLVTILGEQLAPSLKALLGALDIQE